MNLKDKKIVVTGGAGFIGSHLVDRLIKEQPEKIIIVDNFFLGKHRNIEQAFKNFDNLKLYYQDVGHYEKMHNIFKIEEPDVVFNLAVVPLLTSHELPKITCEDNISITLSVLELLKDGLYDTLIHCSSSEAYGTAMGAAMDESHPLHPTTPYAASKAASDLLVDSYANTFDLDFATVRPFNNYGPRQNEESYVGIIPITIQRIMNGQQPLIHWDGLQTRDYIYVKDVVDAFVNVYNHESTRGHTMNVATGQEITILDMVKAIAKELEYEGEFIFEDERPADVRRHRGDIALAQKLFGFEAKTSFDVGIKETVEWYRNTFLGAEND